MPPAKTIKQAKAAFKARDENPITEREQKQLERSLQLDRRAWGLREREKNRVDAAKKRLAQETAQKDEERRLGTQMRKDKFGFKSSQFHLGAFFQRPGPAAASEHGAGRQRQGASIEEEARVEQPEVQQRDASSVALDAGDEFDDDFEDVDDESLLEALQSPETVRTSKPEVQTKFTGPPATTATTMPPPPRPTSTTTTSTSTTFKPPTVASKPPAADFEWQDFLESSTQIARELDSQPSNPPHQLSLTIPRIPQSTAKEAPRTSSFSSGSFDLTEDDMERLDPTPSRVPTKRDEDEERMKMPPPPLPLGKKPVPEQGVSAAKPTCPQPLSSHRKDEEDDGFTMTQLESFVDDDLELTQSG